MSKVFFFSDPHFGHTNMCEKYRNMTVEESNDLIITNWNKVVTKRDKVILLGDIALSKPYLRTLHLLNGIILIVGGNHDTPSNCYNLNELQFNVCGVYEYKGFVCTHIPIHPNELIIHKYRGNIHGHQHDPNIDYGPDYFNVCADVINLTPICFEELEAKFVKRKLYEKESS